jgi:hypothetical protein
LFVIFEFVGWFEGCELLLRHPQIEVSEQQKTMTLLHTLVLTIPRTPSQIAYLETVVELLLSKGNKNNSIKTIHSTTQLL